MQTLKNQKAFAEVRPYRSLNVYNVITNLSIEYTHFIMSFDGKMFELRLKTFKNCSDKTELTFNLILKNNTP